jgi:hypothetical protein
VEARGLITTSRRINDLAVVRNRRFLRQGVDAGAALRTSVQGVFSDSECKSVQVMLARETEPVAACSASASTRAAALRAA